MCPRTRNKLAAKLKLEVKDTFSFLWDLLIITGLDPLPPYVHKGLLDSLKFQTIKFCRVCYDSTIEKLVDT